MKTKAIILSIIIIISGALFISKLYIKSMINLDEDYRTNTCPAFLTTNEPETTISSITTTTTTKVSKKVVKTTKKTTKARIQKVNTAGKETYINYAKEVGGYDDTQMSCLINLWNRESGWNPNSVNKSSGACGIPQALPCSKIKNKYGSNSWEAQIRWGIDYINSVYKTPCKAWNHFKSKNWY